MDYTILIVQYIAYTNQQCNNHSIYLKQDYQSINLSTTILLLQYSMLTIIINYTILYFQYSLSTIFIKYTIIIVYSIIYILVQSINYTISIVYFINLSMTILLVQYRLSTIIINYTILIVQLIDHNNQFYHTNSIVYWLHYQYCLIYEPYYQSIDYTISIEQYIDLLTQLNHCGDCFKLYYSILIVYFIDYTNFLYTTNSTVQSINYTIILSTFLLVQYSLSIILLVYQIYYQCNTVYGLYFQYSTVFRSFNHYTISIAYSIDYTNRLF